MNPQENHEFTEFLRSKAAEGKAALGFPATYFLKMLAQKGGFDTAKKLLAAAKISDGFSDLVARGRPDLTVEAIVTETRWRTYFDPILLERAERRLRAINYVDIRFKSEGGAQSQLPAKSEAEVVERPLPNASADGLEAAEWLKSKYGAKFDGESRKEGHTKGGYPLRLYTLPEGSQVAIRMNQGSPAIYIRARSVAGEDIKDAIAAITPIRQNYPKSDGGAPSSFIMSHAPYLRPGPANELLRLNPAPGQYVRIFELALGRPKETNAAGKSDSAVVSGGRRPISEEEHLRSLERNSKTGRAGEDWVLAWERSRLANLQPPCPDPERYVTHIALSNVGAGYDIVSEWPPGEKRYIEVKTTTGQSAEFFMTENERKTLAALGMQAWIYRVELNADGTTVTTFQDPVLVFDKCMSPSAWRVKLP